MSDSLNDFLEGRPQAGAPPAPPPPPAADANRPPKRPLEPLRRREDATGSASPRPAPGDEYFVKVDRTSGPFDGGASELGAASSTSASANTGLLLAIVVVAALRIALEQNFNPYPLGFAVGGAIAAALVAYGIHRALSSWTDARLPGLVVVPLAVLLAVGAQATLWPLDRQPASTEEVRAAFVPVKGYEYQDVPADVAQQADQLLEASLEQIEEAHGSGDAFGDSEMRILARSGVPVGVVIVIGMDPDLFEDVDVQDEILAGATERGVQVVPVALRGVDAFEWNAPQGRVIMFFDQEDGLMLQVVMQGAGRNELLDVARQLARGVR